MSSGPAPAFAADDADAVALVFATDRTDLTGLQDAVHVTGEDGHHLRRVRRLRTGERVTVADGQGRWCPSVVAGVAEDGLELRITGDVQHEPTLTPRLTVAFALTKGDHPELVVQKATELGADRFVPFLASRSVARRSGRTGVDRLRRVAREAAAQARRARVPEVDEVATVDALVRCPGLVVAERDGTGPGAVPEPEDGEWVVAVGPEGGFDDSERAALAAAPRLAVGPHVLRAETAAIAATAALTSRRRPA